jgi:hypothetical protein
MLESLDILIGLSLIMLVASLVTMLVTQAFLGAAGRRSHHLLCGLTDLLTQLHLSLDAPTARAIAAAVVSHPLVRGSERRRATVVKREEFIKLLFELAAPGAASAATPPLSDSVRRQLLEVLAANGVADPEKTLSNVRMLALELERTHPGLAAATRQTIALTQEAHSEFVAKVNAWFDQTMDRVTERFTFSSRAFTTAAAVLVVAVTQLDTFAVINRLAFDEETRQLFVQQAIGAMPPASQRALPNPGAAGEDTTTAGAASATTTPDLSQETQERVFRAMNDAGMLRMPNSVHDWASGWKTVSPAGVLVSVLLLSLGAPFWFTMLSNLLRLRSVVARQDDIDRAERQLDTSQASGRAAAVTAPGGSPAADASTMNMIAGERGNLGAVG